MILRIFRIIQLNYLNSFISSFNDFLNNIGFHHRTLRAEEVRLYSQSQELLTDLVVGSRSPHINIQNILHFLSCHSQLPFLVCGTLWLHKK